jgi:hypothetical protein
VARSDAGPRALVATATVIAATVIADLLYEDVFVSPLFARCPLHPHPAQHRQVEPKPFSQDR